MTPTAPPAPRGTPWHLYALAIAAGVVQAVSIATPWSGQPLWWLQLLSLAAFFGLLERTTTTARAACAGWLFGTAWLCATYWWLFISLHTYGGLAAPLAVLAVLGLAAFLSLYYGAAAGFYKAFQPLTVAAQAVLLGLLWMLAELLRSHWFTGFPWGAGGYAHVDGAAPWLAPWIGVYGIGGLAAMAAAAVASLLTARRWPLAGGVAALAVAVSVGPALVGRGADAAQGTPLSLALLQGNIPQDEKFQPGTGVPIALQWYGEQLQGATASLVVAPETALPLLPQDLPAGYGEALQARFSTGAQAALVGIPMGSAREGYSNSVLGLRPGQPLYRYDKHHLVPFGEFIPPLFRWFTEMMNIPLGDFNRGGLGQAPFVWQGQRIAPNICYEDLFGEEIARNFADPARAPTILVNLSNIGWFGDSLAIDQHLQISRMRTLEFDRPMVRATNTGATAVIDHRGRVTASLPRLTRGVLLAQVTGRGIDGSAPGAVTPFARWAAQWGLVPLWLLSMGAAAIAAFAFLRRRRT